MTQNHWTWNYDTTELFEIFIKDKRKALYMENEKKIMEEI